MQTHRSTQHSYIGAHNSHTCTWMNKITDTYEHKI